MAWNEDLVKALEGMNRNSTLGSTQVMGLKTGMTFEASRYLASLGTSTNLDTIFLTGNSPAIIFTRNISRTGDSLSMALYRSPTYTGGTALPSYCLNQVSPATASSALLSGATVSAVGTQISSTMYILSNSSLLGLGGAGGSGTLGSAIYVPANTAFLFRINNPLLTAQAINLQLNWYEGVL